MTPLASISVGGDGGVVGGVEVAVVVAIAEEEEEGTAVAAAVINMPVIMSRLVLFVTWFMLLRVRVVVWNERWW